MRKDKIKIGIFRTKWERKGWRSIKLQNCWKLLRCWYP